MLYNTAQDFGAVGSSDILGDLLGIVLGICLNIKFDILTNYTHQIKQQRLMMNFPFVYASRTEHE
jgi:hypothetical protein